MDKPTLEPYLSEWISQRLTVPQRNLIKTLSDQGGKVLASRIKVQGNCVTSLRKLGLIQVEGDSGSNTAKQMNRFIFLKPKGWEVSEWIQ